MAMSVVYATVNGRLVQENRGGTVTRYIADTLGSVIQTRDAAGNQTSSTTYWPFGEVRTSSGTNPSPWGFCGIWGYFRDAASRLYIRARYYRPREARWNTLDPLWPGQLPYQYVRNAPTLLVDPSGLFPLACAAACIAAGGCALGVWMACKDWNPGYPSFMACAAEFIANLPLLQRLGCLGGLAGCLACLTKPWVPIIGGGAITAIYGYGKCCGLNRRCRGCETVANGGAIDCVDEACAQHDKCLGTLKEYINPVKQMECNRALCRRAIACQDSGSCTSDGCNQAANEIRVFYCTLALL